MAIDNKEAKRIIEEHKRILAGLDAFVAEPNALTYTVDLLADSLFEKANPNKDAENATCNDVVINLDTKSNPTVNDLIVTTAKYFKYQETLKAVSDLLGDGARFSMRASIEGWMDSLNSYLAMGAIKRTFLKNELKNKYIVDYQMLKDHLTNDYGTKATSLLGSLNVYDTVGEKFAWDDYQANFEKYKQTIEELSGVIITRGDEQYGLSDELAEKLEKTTFLKDGLKCELRRYQEWGVKYALTQKNVLLGDEMGLGKTVQAIATMVALNASGEATHHMVVCPASVLTNWCREISKMSTLNPIKLHGSNKDKMFEEWMKNGGVAVTTYETTGRFELGDFKFGLLCVDEAHYVKNTSAQRTQNVIKIAEHATYKLFMTGTALENKVEEMVALIKILDKTEDGKEGETFREASRLVKTDLKELVGGKRDLKLSRKFQEAVKNVYFRRRRKDVLGELPELTISEEWCDLLPEESKIYEKSVSEGKFVESRRVSWNIDDLEKSSKAIRLKSLIEQAEESGRKAIVFSFFLDTIEKVQMLLGDRCIGPINGSVPPEKRQEFVDQLNDAPAGSVLVAQIQSGGTGLNIQAASVIILCEPQLKPSIENQAISRAYRMGQERDVLVYRLLCDDTIDERLYEVIKAKQAQFDAFADESIAGAEAIELDEKTLGDIFKAELDRLKAKNGITDDAEAEDEPVAAEVEAEPEVAEAEAPAAEE